jgi:hypothetical protein
VRIVGSPSWCGAYMQTRRRAVSIFVSHDDEESRPKCRLCCRYLPVPSSQAPCSSRGRPHVTTLEPSLSDDQRRVLQMIYDKFRERETWPTFGDIDR